MLYFYRISKLLIFITCLYVTRNELDANCVGLNSFDLHPSKLVSHKGEPLDSSDEESEDEGHDGRVDNF